MRTGRRPPKDSANAEDRDSEYLGWTEAQIIAELRSTATLLLVRGKATTLIARRHAGELLFALAKQYRRDRKSFEAASISTVGLKYGDARKHIQLFIYWARVEAVVDRIKAEAAREHKPVVIPGYYKLLKMAGVIEDRRRPAQPPDDPGEEVELLDIVPAVLDDLAAAKEIIFKLQRELRVARETIVVLRNDLAITNETVRNLHKRQKMITR